MPVYKKKNGRWGIRNVPGDHATRGKALKQLQAIKAAQARKRGE